jgi:hypothetical protein
MEFSKTVHRKGPVLACFPEGKWFQTPICDNLRVNCSLRAARGAHLAARSCGLVMSLIPDENIEEDSPSGGPNRTRKVSSQWFTGSSQHPRARTARATWGVSSRKEVIQPHLPVRLPCYDFVPIAGPTFDGSPPYGLGHRLRVLPTFMT